MRDGAAGRTNALLHEIMNQLRCAAKIALPVMMCSKRKLDHKSVDVSVHIIVPWLGDCELGDDW
jgi:hypothetical protein